MEKDKQKQTKASAAYTNGFYHLIYSDDNICKDLTCHNYLFYYV